jgi:hypothetical protein
VVDREREAVVTALAAGADSADQRHVLMADREPIRVGMVAAQRIVLPGPVVEGPIRKRGDRAPRWVTIHADILPFTQSGRRASGDLKASPQPSRVSGAINKAIRVRRAGRQIWRVNSAATGAVAEGVRAPSADSRAVPHA